MSYKPGPGDDFYCPDATFVPVGLVGNATIAAAKALVELGNATDFDAVRGEVIRGFANEFACAYGMRAEDTYGRLEHCGYGIETRLAFVQAVQSLDCSKLTPEHFGSVHERLSGWKIEGGKLVPSSERRGGGVHFTPRSLTEPMVRKTLEPLFALVPAERTLDLRVGDPAVGAGAFLLEAARQLGQRLVDARIERDILVAKRLAVVHCLYGIDISPWAVASAKIALFLECRAENMPRGWLDDNIKVGDGLVGLSEKQMVRFHWPPDGRTKKGELIPEVPECRAVLNEAMAVGVRRRQERIGLLASAARGSP